MCPSAPDPIDLDAYSTDEELILFLVKRRFGDPIPLNVIEVNPFSIDPWDSPEDAWFLYESKESQAVCGGGIIKATKNGYWKSMEDVIISSSTNSIGRKTTRQFYIGQAPFGDGTGWMMHQYQAENNLVQENIKEQDSSSLCRLFLQLNVWPRDDSECDQINLNHCNPVSPEPCEHERIEQCASVTNEHCDPASPEVSDPLGVESMLMRFLDQEEERNSSEDAADRVQVVAEDAQTPESSARYPQDLEPCQEILNNNPEDEMQTNCDFSKGDFLELKDLYDPEASSTSSDNSSLMSMNSDDYFDGDALLRDIENEENLNIEEDRVDHRFNISTSSRSNQVVIRPPISGSADNDSSNLIVTERVATNNDIIVHNHERASTMDPQSDRDASISSSSGESPVNETRSGSPESSSSSRGSRSARRIAKLRKMYCCFSPSEP